MRAAALSRGLMVTWRLEMELQNTGPSRWYYGLAVLVMFAGMALFVVTIWKGLSAATSKLQQVAAPGQTEITLGERGEYTVFYEFKSVMDKRVYSSSESVPGLEFKLVSKSTGAEVELKPTSVNSTYAIGGRSGKSIFDFQIDQPGVYVLTTAYPRGREGDDVVLAVGNGFTGGIFKTVVGGIAVMFGSIILSILIAVMTAVKRNRAGNRPQTMGGPPPPIE